MTWSRLAHVFMLALVGLTLRVAIFRDVVVNGDTGLYLYDAKQILWGKRIMIDFPSRSPVMEYLLAGVIALTETPIIGARSFMVVVGVLVGIGVYALARQLHSHRAGVVAAAIWYLSPFSLVWGLWVKTEPVAELIALGAVLVLFAAADRDRPMLVVGAAGVGALFGVAFLVRRVVIVHVGIIGLWLFWYRWQIQSDPRGGLAAGGALATAMLATLGVGYLAIAGGVELAGAVAYFHGAALLVSDGQGWLAWVHTPTKSIATAADESGLLAQLCQKCGGQTVVVIIRTLLLTLPVWLLTLPLVRSVVGADAGSLSDHAVPATIAGAGVLITVPYLALGRWVPVAAAIAGLAAVALVWWTPPLGRDDLLTPRRLLLVGLLIGLGAGYLYRNRVLYVTYFQDLYPWLVVLAAITVVTWWDGLDDDHRRVAGVLGVACLLVTTGVAVGYASPYRPSGDVDGSHWFTVDLVQAYGADIAARTESGDRVLTAQPLYVIESDRRLVADLSRRYYLFRNWPRAGRTRALERRLVASISRGEAAYAISDTELKSMRSDKLRTALETNYCVVDAPLYDRTDGTLYRRCSP